MNVNVTNTVNELRLKKGNAMCGFHYSQLGLTLQTTFAFTCVYFSLLYQVLVLGTIKITEEEGTWFLQNNFKVSRHYSPYVYTNHLA
jgi:hypothetical protein